MCAVRLQLWLLAWSGLGAVCLPGRACLRLAAAAALAAPRWAGSSWAGLSDCRTGLGWLGGLGTGGEAPALRTETPSESRASPSFPFIKSRPCQDWHRDLRTTENGQVCGAAAEEKEG